MLNISIVFKRNTLLSKNFKHGYGYITFGLTWNFTALQTKPLVIDGILEIF